MLSAAFLDWPFVALALGVLGLLVLVFWPRKPGSPSRWRDPEWLVSLMLPLYMLHQFEESGINVLGQRYHFLSELCANVGYPDVAGCPGTPAFVFAVNVGGVWLAGLLAIVFRRRNILVSACALAIPFVNALAHLAAALLHGTYNSGVLTALVLFLPLCIWTYAQLFRVGVLDAKRLGVVIFSGVVMHAVLLGSLLARASGLPEAAFLSLNVANGLVPLGFGALLGALAGRRVSVATSGPGSVVRP
jgi:hypothetical protein